MPAPHLAQAGDTLDHHEFLRIVPTESHPALIQALVGSIGQAPIFVIYSCCAPRLISEPCRGCRERETALGATSEPLWDLLPIILKHFHHPVFRGSVSIKSVLPALTPDAIKPNMSVEEGVSAMVQSERAQNESYEALRQPILDALRAYCRPDMPAMLHLCQILLS